MRTAVSAWWKRTTLATLAVSDTQLGIKEPPNATLQKAHPAVPSPSFGLSRTASRNNPLAVNTEQVSTL